MSNVVPRSAEKWLQLLSEQGRSGLSVAAFCARHELSQASFYAWKRRLRSEASVPSPGEETFVRLAVAESAATIMIERPDGLVLRVPCDEQALRLTLRILDERRC